METKQTIQIYDIVVIGANGGIGRQTVERALMEGHFVTAIVRNPENLKIVHPYLKIVKGDILNSDTLDEHLQNKDVVISAIGKNSFKPTTLYSEGNKNLVAAMKRTGIDRVFFISASGLDVNPSHSLFVKFLTKFVLQKLLKNMYADLRVMETIVKESGLNWTIVRPPRLTDAPAKENYRISAGHFLNNALSISRADVAHFMVHHVANQSIYKSTVEVAY